MRASTTGTTRLLSAAGFLMLASLALPYGPGALWPKLSTPSEGGCRMRPA
jgi:hypothetical protein